MINLIFFFTSFLLVSEGMVELIPSRCSVLTMIVDIAMITAIKELVAKHCLRFQSSPNT